MEESRTSSDREKQGALEQIFHTRLQKEKQGFRAILCLPGYLLCCVEYFDTETVADFLDFLSFD